MGDVQGVLQAATRVQQPQPQPMTNNPEVNLAVRTAMQSGASQEQIMRLAKASGADPKEMKAVQETLAVASEQESLRRKGQATVGAAILNQGAHQGAHQGAKNKELENENSSSQRKPGNGKQDARRAKALDQEHFTSSSNAPDKGRPRDDHHHPERSGSDQGRSTGNENTTKGSPQGFKPVNMHAQTKSQRKSIVVASQNLIKLSRLLLHLEHITVIREKQRGM